MGSTTYCAEFVNSRIPHGQKMRAIQAPRLPSRHVIIGIVAGILLNALVGMGQKRVARLAIANVVDFYH